MSTPRAKRTVFNDGDLHTIVDIVCRYKHIVECKKTDVLTWKEKDACWVKIAKEFNSIVMDKKTSEQLRTKYDNLKKETRRYFAKQRQDVYRTGGGIPENIREILKTIYEKIKNVTSLSVEGIIPQAGDSDFHDVHTLEDTTVEDNLSMYTGECSQGSSTHASEELAKPLDMHVETTNVEATSTNDWSTYTPAMLRSKKHKLLRTKQIDKSVHTKYGNTTTKVLNEITNAKVELLKLQTEVLINEERRKDKEDERKEKEDKRKEELHAEMLKSVKLNNQHLKLQNELLQLQIEKLKK